MGSIDEYSGIFNAESEKLESAVNAALEESELPISEIVGIYYQIMNVASIVALLKKQISGHGDDDDVSLSKKIDEIVGFISSKFDSNLHPLIMTQLANSVADATKNLTSGNNSKKSKDNVESEAKLYEQLREMMSTKEFVEQYDRGLSHD